MSDGSPAHVLQPAAIDHVIDTLAPCGAQHLSQLAAEIEIFLDLHFRVERDVFRKITKIFADFLRFMEDIESIDAGPAAAGWQIAREYPQGCGFSRPVGPQEPDDQPLGHLETDAIDR